MQQFELAIQINLIGTFRCISTARSGWSNSIRSKTASRA